MARKKRDSGGDEGGGYSYMDTYGDLVTLLLCFFVLLYSFSSVDSQKWQELVMALSSGGSRAVTVAPLDPGASSDDTETSSEEDNKPSAEFSELYDKVQKYVEEKGLTGEIEAEWHNNNIRISFVDEIFFDSGYATLKPDSIQVITDVVALIDSSQSIIQEVRIDGHTDDKPISNASYSDNWDLSIDRAKNVLREVFKHTSTPHAKFAATGYGEYRPRVENNSDPNRAKNRRVEFILEEIGEYNNESSF